MMKHDCDIVRDLMPLCIDNTASENSRKMVGEHVLECKPCMDMYQEMRTEVPKELPVNKDAEPFRHTVRKLRKKRRTRKIVIGVIGVVLGVLLVLIAGSTWTRLTNDYALIADDEDYDFDLARRSNGQIVITHYNYNGKRQDARWSFDDETGILKLYAVTPTWALKTDRVSTPYLYKKDFWWDPATGRLKILRKGVDGQLHYEDVKEVWKGAKFKGNGYMYKVLYVQGYDLPLVSADIDADYALTDTVYYQDSSMTPAVDGKPQRPFMTIAPTATPMPPQPTPAPRTPEEEAAWQEANEAELKQIEAMEHATLEPRPMIVGTTPPVSP